MALVRSKRLPMDWPSASRITSPTSRWPAAAEPAATWSTTNRPTVTSWGYIKRPVNTASGRTAFINGPAASTSRRAPAPLPARLRGTLGLDSPANRTKPPKGNKLTEYNMSASTMAPPSTERILPSCFSRSSSAVPSSAPSGGRPRPGPMIRATRLPSAPSAELTLTFCPGANAAGPGSP